MVSTLFRHARFHTFTGSETPVEAVLSVDGVIVASGGDVDVRALARAGTTEVDLEGRAVVPGFVDAHIHSASYARERHALDLRGARSLEEALEGIRAHAQRLPKGQWIFAGRWDSNTWDVPVQPDRHSLDRVCPDRPVALPSVDGHTIWANSAALAVIGYDASTPDPIGGEIVRDDRGEPTGILRESARYPLRELMGSPLAGELIDQLRSSQEHLLSLGLTGLHDIDGEDARSAYLELAARGELKLRIHKAITADHLDAAIEEGRFTGDGDDWFQTGPVKFFSDGALGSHTSHMGEDFAGQSGNHGIEVIPYPELRELVRRATAARIAVATHAIGDQANHLVLNAYEEVAALSRAAGLRHRIEHAQHIRWDDVPRFAALEVIPSLQPTHCTSDIPLSESLLAGRSLANYAWRSLADAGAHLAYGSDAPIEDPNPLHGIHAAVTRQNAVGSPAGGWEPEQRISVREALAAHSAGGAYAANREHRQGRLAPGQLADFVALERDPFDIEPESLRDLRVMTTVVGGDVRFQR
ncbi:amidohydrolase [Agromyces sp. NPDC056379]|uniref:amidohydrolase n=1 Tax=unclassified Agromyces TaxID=2639701 RepID=UPI0035DD4D39